MMKLYFCFVVALLICSTYSTNSGWSNFYVGNAVNKDFPGMCFYNQTQTPIEIGSVFKPGNECVQIYCREDFVLKFEYCPFYMVGAGCKVTFDKDAEYPKCCANITCPEKKL